MVRKTLLAFGVLAGLGVGAVSAASAAPVNGAALREAVTGNTDVTSVGYYGYYYPRYYGYYHRYYYPRYYGYGY